MPKVKSYIDLMLKLKAFREEGKTLEDELKSGITDQLDVAWNELDGEEVERVEQELKKVWPQKEDRR